MSTQESSLAKVTDVQVQRARLIINPQAWHDTSEEDVIAHIVAQLAKHGIQVDPVQTTPQDHGAQLAKSAIKDGYQIVIAAGGDGTIHEVAKGLIGSKVALGIIPFGTMNNIAHCLYIPDDLDQACAIIAEGRRQPMDVGMLNGQPFLEAASLGIEVPFFALGELTRHRGFMGIMQAAWGAAQLLIRFQPLKVTLEMDGRTKSIRAQQITISNTPRYGLGFQAAPDAKLDDGLLDVVIARHAHRSQLIRHYWSILNGQREIDTKVQVRRAKRIRIFSKQSLPIAIDGEPAGTLPVTITVASRRLVVLAGIATEQTAPATPGVVGILRSMAPHDLDHAPNVYSMPENAQRMRQLTTWYWIGATILAGLAFVTRQLGWWSKLPTPKAKEVSSHQQQRHTVALGLIPLAFAALFFRLRMWLEALAFLTSGLMGAIISPIWRRVTQRFPHVVEPDDATMHAVASVGVLTAGLWASRRSTWRRFLLTSLLATVGTWLSFLDRRSSAPPAQQRDSIALGAGLGVLWLGGMLSLITWFRQSILHLTNSAEIAPAKPTHQAAPSFTATPGIRLSLPIAMNTPLERGDILLFGPDGTLGAQMIEFVTRSYYHHIAIYDDDGMVIEAMPEGVRRAPLGERRTTGIRLGIPAEQRHAVAEWARSHIGDPYDSRGLAVIAFDRIFPGLRVGGPPANRFSCAVFVADAYMQEGYDLLPNQRWQELVPGDFIALVNTYPKVAKEA